MLRISIPKSTRDYFITSLSKGDYYSEQAEIVGKWEGLGASKIGITGDIQKAQFDLLCGGLHPITGQKLTSRLSTKRREAYDLTFSTPKSISLLYALANEQGALEIEKVTLQAMKETMFELEKNIQCRVRNKGQNENRISGNLTYGYFVHKNSRPVDGFPDPHLHIHTVVMNLTYDQVDNKWKAIEMRDKYENRQYYQAIFNSKLTLGLQTIGLRTRKTDFNFELEGVFDLTKNDFSRRTAEINAEAIKRNIYNPKQKDKLGARTRNSKSDKLSQSELKEIYRNLISSDNQKDWLDNLIRTVEPPNKPLQFQELQTQKWFSYTLENTFERHSVTSEQRFLADVLKNGVGQTNLEEVKNLYQRYVGKGIILSEVDPPLNNHKSYKKENEWKNLIPGNLQNLSKVNSLSSRNNISPSITTKICLLEEQNIVKIIDSKINRFNPLNHQYSKTILKDPYLNLNQKKVVSDIMLSLDGVELLDGKAGTGKTTTLKAVEKGLLEIDRQVTILAPTNKAVEVLQLEGFTNAMTVQKYLAGGNIFTNKNDHQSHVSTFQENIYNKPIELTPKEKLKTIPIKDYQTYTNPRNYIIVDEASLVSVRQMDRLLSLADKYSQRVLLVGDMKQHKSVERGNILRVIGNYSNIETHYLDQIIRQQEPQANKAVDHLSRGNIEHGLREFNQLGWVKEIQNDKKRLAKVAEIYFDYLPKVQAENIKKDIIPVEKPYYKQANTPLARILKGRLPWDNTKEFELIEKARLEKVEYQKLTNQPSTLVITPTHRDGQEIHQAIRAKLKQENLIDQKDHTIQTLRSLSWTQAQKQENSNYQAGQVLQFTRNKDIFQKGDKWEVIEVENKVKLNLDNQAIQTIEKTTKSYHKGDNISLSNSNSEDKKLNINQLTKELLKIQNTKTKEIQDIPLSQNQTYEVYQKQNLKLSKGDLIQTQAARIILDSQNKPHHTSNGAVYQIKDIDSKTGDLRLQNDWILPKDFANLKSAYYSTSHASQGQTVNHSIFYTSNKSVQNLSQEMVYVSNSRFKKTNTILTPDFKEFKQQAQKGEMNTVALDVRHPEIQIKSKQKVIEQRKGIEYQKWHDKQPKVPAKVRTIEREIGISMSM